MIAIATRAFKLNTSFWRVENRRGKKGSGGEIGKHVRNFEPTGLEPGSDNGRLFGCFPYLLQFERENLQATVVVNRGTYGYRVIHISKRVKLPYRHGDWAIEMQRIAQVASQGQRVDSRRPLPMVTQNHTWMRLIVRSQIQQRRRRVVPLRHISRPCVGIDRKST